MHLTPPTRGPWSYLAWLVLQQRRRVALRAFLGTVWMVGLMLPPFLLSRAVDGLADAERDAMLAWSAALVVVGAVLAWLGIWRHRTMTQVRMDAAFRTVCDHDVVVEEGGFSLSHVASCMLFGTRPTSRQLSLRSCPAGMEGFFEELGGLNEEVSSAAVPEIGNRYGLTFTLN